MRDLGQLWKDCHTGKVENGMWEYQRKIIIGGVEYNDEDIIDVSFERGLMDRSISFGNAISAKLNATIIPHTDQIVNRNSKVEYYVRVIDLYDNVSPWAKFGEFYIERAENEFNRWSIECYDAMYRAEVNFPKGEYSSTEAINLIANRMNIKIDSRTKPNVTFTVKDAQEYTMREVLGYIAGMSTGSYYITEEGKLKFTKLRINSPVQEILPSNTKKIVGSDKMRFDKVIVKYGSNVDERYEAGSGSREYEVFNPFADPGLAGRMLGFFDNYTFYPGDMSSTEIDPAIELGDTILIDNNGEKLVTNLINVHFNSRMYADVETPFDTDKFQDTFHFSGVGKDYDDEIEDHEDRISYLEDYIDAALGDGDCMLVRKGDLDGGYMSEAHHDRLTAPKIEDRCLFLNKNVENFKIKGYFDDWINPDFKDFRIIGKGLKTASFLGYNYKNGVTVTNADLTKLDLSRVEDARSMFYASPHVLGSTATINSNSFKRCKSFDYFHRREIEGFPAHGSGDIKVTGKGFIKPEVEFTARKAGYPISRVLDFSNCTDMRELVGNHSDRVIDVNMRADNHIGFSRGDAMKDILGLTFLRLHGGEYPVTAEPSKNITLKLPRLIFKENVRDINFGVINLNLIEGLDNIEIKGDAEISITIIGGGIMPSFGGTPLKSLSISDDKLFDDDGHSIPATIDLSQSSFVSEGFRIGSVRKHKIEEVIIPKSAPGYVKNIMYAHFEGKVTEA